MKQDQAFLHEDISRQHDIKRGSSRSVGIVFAVVFMFVAAYPLLDGEPIRLWSAIVAVAFFGASILRPKSLDSLSWLWFRFGMALHAVVSPIVLGFLFFVVITPIGLLMRLTKKDPLRLNLTSNATSYWIDRTPPGPPPDSMKHQTASPCFLKM